MSEHNEFEDRLNLHRRAFVRTSGLIAAASMVELGWHEAEAAGYRYHTVQRNESLSKIAEKYKTSITQLKKLNALRSDLIRVGQRLKVGISSTSSSSASGGYRYHTVRRGDYLSGLAQRYGTSVTQIMRMNGLTSDVIRIGQKLRIGKAGFRYVNPSLVRVRNLKPSLWRNIITHHSAIRDGNAEIYGRAHKRRGMENGLAYHFLIGNGRDSKDGEIEIGPRWTRQIEGGHVKSRKYNLTSIGICLIGDFQKFRPTAKQLAAFKELTSYLKYDLLGGKPRFYVHNDLEKTLCPGRYFPKKEMHKMFG